MTVLSADELNTDPFLLFNQWFAEAQQSEINDPDAIALASVDACLLYTSPSPRDATLSRMPSSA